MLALVRLYLHYRRCKESDGSVMGFYLLTNDCVCVIGGQQTEIAKRLNAIIVQVLPFLSQEVKWRGDSPFLSLFLSCSVFLSVFFCFVSVRLCLSSCLSLCFRWIDSTEMFHTCFFFYPCLSSLVLLSLLESSDPVVITGFLILQWLSS